MRFELATISIGVILYAVHARKVGKGPAVETDGINFNRDVFISSIFSFKETTSNRRYTVAMSYKVQRVSDILANKLQKLLQKYQSFADALPINSFRFTSLYAVPE